MIFFLIFAQKHRLWIHLGGSNAYPQSMFRAKNKKIMYTLCKPQFYCIQGGVRGSSLHGYVFVMALSNNKATNLQVLAQFHESCGESWFMCTICTREQINTRVQICTPLRRVHMPINCVHTHLDLIRNLT